MAKVAAGRLEPATPIASPVLQDFAAVRQRWRIWFIMGNQDVLMRYRRSIIGPFWLSITMACFIIGIGLLYSQVFRRPIEDFLIYLAGGLLAWNLIAALVNEGAMAVAENESSLRSVTLPLPLLAMRVVYRNFLIFLHNAVVVLALLLFFGHRIDPILVMVIPAIATYLALGLFGSVALAPFCARFRDIPQVLSNVMQIAFFITPIFWPIDTIQRPVIILANPFFHLVEIVRRPILGELPTALNWGVSLGLLVLLATLALTSLKYTRSRVFMWL